MAVCGVDQLVNAQGITNASLYHKPGIIDQVISGDNIRFCHCICKIYGHAAAVGGLAWHNQPRKKQEYVVLGIYQCANGMGSNIGMSMEGYSQIDCFCCRHGCRAFGFCFCGR